VRVLGGRICGPEHLSRKAPDANVGLRQCEKTLATLARNLAPCACSGFIKRASNLYENILPVAIRTVYLGHSNRN
jgi:hypothetical protein